MKAFENLMHGHQPTNIKLPVVGIGVGVKIGNDLSIKVGDSTDSVVSERTTSFHDGRGDDLQMAQEVLHHEEPSSSTMEEMLLS